MSQPRILSMIETGTNVVAGLVLAVLAQVLVFPLFGLRAALYDNLRIAALFTTLSILRSYALRRPFDRLGRQRP